MIEIKHRFAGAILYVSQDATTLAYAIIEAVKEGANLEGADLRSADLRSANLMSAYLRSANLEGADLGGANLEGANLMSAYLGGADLGGANLEGANLGGANLCDADLRSANLEPIKQDLWSVLSAAPAEVPALLAVLRAGQFDGTVYEGECACLVGSIANARHCNYNAILQLVPNANRPAERWALAIGQGDTPDMNPVAKLTEEWIVEWMATHPAPDASTAVES